MIHKMVVLDRNAYLTFIESRKAPLYSRATLIMAGVIYGLMAIVANIQFLLNFDSLLLGYIIAPLLLIALGILTAIITKFSVTLLLWAGARAFSGPGRMKEINQIASISLLPGLLGAPFLINMNAPGQGFIMLIVMVGLILGITWMYLMCVKIIEATQKFTKGKAYLSVFASFVFFSSVYYLLSPTLS